jgi:replication factor A1
MTTISDLVKQYRSKGFVIDDVASLEKHYNLLASEFQIPHDEAIANVKRALDRKFGLIKTEFDQPSNPDEVTRLGDMLGGFQVMCEGTVTALTEPSSPKLKYAGILADDTGSIKFIVLSGNDVELEVGSSYLFDGCRSSDEEPLTLLCFKKSPVKQIDKTFTPHEDPTDLNDMVPGVCTVLIKCTSLRTPHEKAYQQGRVGDESGNMTFATWKRGTLPTLEEGKVYHITNAVAQRYKESLTLDFTLASAEEVDEDLDVKPDGAEVTGDIVKMWGSEVRPRCPECRKPLQPVGAELHCDDHGAISNPVFELRCKGRVDDGINVQTVIFGNRVIETLTGFTLQEALRIMSASPFGKQAIEDILHDRMFGRRVILRCFVFEDWHIAQDGKYLYSDATPAWKLGQATIEEVA